MIMLNLRVGGLAGSRRAQELRHPQDSASRLLRGVGAPL